MKLNSGNWDSKIYNFIKHFNEYFFWIQNFYLEITHYRNNWNPLCGSQPWFIPLSHSLKWYSFPKHVFAFFIRCKYPKTTDSIILYVTFFQSHKLYPRKLFCSLDFSPKLCFWDFFRLINFLSTSRGGRQYQFPTQYHTSTFFFLRKTQHFFQCNHVPCKIRQYFPGPLQLALALWYSSSLWDISKVCLRLLRKIPGAAADSSSSFLSSSLFPS